MRKILLFSILLFSSFISFSQDQTNKGKDFWIPYPEHIDGTNSAMGLYISSDTASTGVITVGATTIPFTVVANTVVYKFLGPNGGGDAPNTGVYLGGFQDNVVSGRGIHITATRPVVVFAHIIRSARSGATLVLPTKVWGKEYIISNYANSGSSQSFAELNVYASKPNTVIEITPTVATRNGAHAPGVPFQVTIPNVGDVYQLQFAQNADPSGTLVKSVASGTGCNPIAVFSATTWSGINCNNASGGDNFYQQLFPSSSWGKQFFTGPLKKVATNGADNNVDIIRVFVKDPTTVVTKTDNGITTTLTGLTAQNYYQYTASRPTFIQADKPVEVIQYITSQSCGNPQTNSDPEMIALSAVEQTINDITVFSAHQSFVPPGQSQVTTHYINVIMKTANTSLFRINGVAPNAAFTAIPGTIYSYLKEDVTARAATNPIFRLKADSGFIAIAYGFGNVESYGYNAGTNVRDLYQQIGVNTEYGIEQTPSVCTNSPFRFKVSLPYCADSIKWDLHNLPGLPVPQQYPVIYYSTCTPGPGGPDSTTVVNGKTIYWYSLPSIYSFSVVGTYGVTITTYFPNGECGNSQDIDFDLQVSAPPVASFGVTIPGCYLEAVRFEETTPQTPKPTYKWWWDFGEPSSGAANNSTLRSPTHTYAAPGTYTIRFTNITTPGCLSDTLQQSITIPDLPSATISGTMDICQNGTSPIITFTATNGRAPYDFTYNINGGASQTVTSTGTGNTATVVVPTNVPGTFVYNLVSVKNTGSAVCIQNQTGSATVIVNPLPTATVSGNNTVCLNDAAPNVTFTGATGTAPYTFTYTINGGAPQTVTTVSGNSVTVAVPTGTAGTFIYNLVSVKDASSTTCSQNQSGSVTVIVKDLPTATIAGTVNVCLNATSPNITFTGATGTAPYTFTYNVNGGANQTITTTVGNSVTLAAPTNVAGTFVYNLLNVKEGSANACTQNQSGSATVVVNPLPTASVSGTIIVCLNATSPNITFTGAGSTAPYTFTYTINGGAPQTVTTVSGNSVTVAVPTNVAGTFVYNLVSVKDASSTQCSQVQTGSATVTVNQLPTAVISGTTAVCLNSPSPLITFTGASGTAPYTFTYNINGGGNLTVTTAAGNTVTVAVPTTATGTFIYNLLNVKEGSANACEQPQTGSASVTVNPLPTATISGTTAVCLNATSPLVTFTGAGSTAPYTFTYNINGGANQTITTAAGNSVTIAVPTNVAGTFVYNLVSVKDGSSTICSQAQPGSAVITVHPLPVPNFTNTTPSCETRDITFTDVSNPLAGSLTNWSWNFGDGNTGAGALVTHNYATAGSYNVSLTVTTSNGCSNAAPFIKVVTISNRPLAGYIIPEVCLSDTYAQFIDTSKVANGTVNQWAWNFGDPFATVPNPNTSTLQNPTHSYTAVGVYNVQLIATNTVTGCKDTVTHPLQINGSFPVANFTVNNPTTLCANDSVAIVNTSTVFPGNITKVEIYWDNVNFPGVFQLDDNPYSGKIYRHMYPNFQTPLTKTFTIRFRAYSGGVCVNDKIGTITVNAAPKVQFNNMPDACLFAAPFQITQATETGGVPGTFVFTGPGVSATGLFTPATAGVGTHWIKYTYTSSAGGCVDTMSRPITVLDTATAKFSFVAPTCEGTATTFKEESTAPAGITLSNTVWNFGDGSPLQNHAPGSSFTHTYPAWGPYTVTMYNTSAYGCKSTNKQQQVYISPIPQTKFTFGQNSVCLPNADISFINNSTIADGTENQFIYLWNFGDVASGTLNFSTAKTPPPHHYSGTGPYTVKLTVTSGTQCSSSYPLQVNFIHPQPKTVFDFNKPSVCIGDNVLMRDLTNGLDGTITQWFWSFSDGGSAGTKQVNYLFGSAATYNVTLYTVNSNGCNSDTVTQPFTVYPYPTVDAGADRVVLEGGSITLAPIVTGNDLQYLWTPNTYLNNDRIEAPTASNMLDDITYTLTVTGRGGCTAPPDKMFVKVLKAPKVPNTFTPNGDGINDTWKIEYLDTYPNNKVQVFTRTGQLVFESRGYKTPWDGRFNGKPLPFDTYYYIIEPENGRKPVTGYVTIVK